MSSYYFYNMNELKNNIHYIQETFVSGI